MGIDLKTARRNVIKFFESPYDIYVPGVGDKLGRISILDLFGRVVEWIKDWHSNWERSKKTDKIFKESLEIILTSLEEDPKANYSFVFCSTPKLPCFEKYAVDYSNKTMDQLADRVIESSFNDKREIHELAVKIKEKTLNILKELTPAEKKALAEHPFL